MLLGREENVWPNESFAGSNEGMAWKCTFIVLCTKIKHNTKSRKKYKNWNYILWSDKTRNRTRFSNKLEMSCNWIKSIAIALDPISAIFSLCLVGQRLVDWWTSLFSPPLTLTPIHISSHICRFIHLDLIGSRRSMLIESCIQMWILKRAKWDLIVRVPRGGMGSVMEGEKKSLGQWLMIR